MLFLRGKQDCSLRPTHCPFCITTIYMYIHVMFKFLSYLHTYVIGCVYTHSMLWVDITRVSSEVITMDPLKRLGGNQES